MSVEELRAKYQNAPEIPMDMEESEKGKMLNIFLTESRFLPLHIPAAFLYPPK